MSWEINLVSRSGVDIFYVLDRENNRRANDVFFSCPTAENWIVDAEMGKESGVEIVPDHLFEKIKASSTFPHWLQMGKGSL